jgi:hypothetical protein
MFANCQNELKYDVLSKSSLYMSCKNLPLYQSMYIDNIIITVFIIESQRMNMIQSVFTVPDARNFKRTTRFDDFSCNYASQGMDDACTIICMLCCTFKIRRQQLYLVTERREVCFSEHIFLFRVSYHQSLSVE